MWQVHDLRIPESAGQDSDLWEFASHVAHRWRVFAFSLVVAVPLVLAISFFLPKKYTATASILIEPPAGNDPRGSTAVSPVYLESLKTYEHFVLSDSLFQQAVQALSLRKWYGSIPIETLKRSVLEVTKPRDTKVLEIRATLKDPTLARDVARYLAMATVKMNRALDAASTSDLTAGGDQVMAAARQKLEQAKAHRAQLMATEPITELDTEALSGKELQDHLLRDLSSARAELAAYESRSSPGKQGPPYLNSEDVRQAVGAERAEVASLSDQLSALRTDLTRKNTLLEIRKQHREMAEKDVAIAQQQFDAASSQRNEIISSIAFRGERLEIIDPGIVPQKPSSPNIPLNVFVAGAAATIGCMFYLAVEFGRKRFVR